MNKSIDQDEYFEILLLQVTQFFRPFVDFSKSPFENCFIFHLIFHEIL